MSLCSMTGFGRASFAAGERTYWVEIRSVNHRYLDLRIRLPRHMLACESAVREVVTKRLWRGRVDLTVDTPSCEADNQTRVSVDLSLARSLAGAAEQVAAQLGWDDHIGLAQVLSFPGVLCPITVEADVDTVEVGGRLAAGVEAALDALIAMRRKEGLALAAEFEFRLGRIEALERELAVRAPEQERTYRRRLEQRIAELCAQTGAEFDVGLVLHEIAIFAERTDVAEELARLRSHVEQARTLTTSGDAPCAVGRRLDFLCQEVNREVNTIGSKVADIGMTEQVIELKAELERLREQAQNVE